MRLTLLLLFRLVFVNILSSLRIQLFPPRQAPSRAIQAYEELEKSTTYSGQLHPTISTFSSSPTTLLLPLSRLLHPLWAAFSSLLPLFPTLLPSDSLSLPPCLPRAALTRSKPRPPPRREVGLKEGIEIGPYDRKEVPGDVRAWNEAHEGLMADRAERIRLEEKEKRRKRTTKKSTLYFHLLRRHYG